jgi:ATP-dependent protease ClpP protease subunit
MPRSKPRVSPDFLAQRIQTVLGTGVDFDSRVMYIVGEICADITFRTIPALRLLDKDRKLPVTIILSSHGGSEPDGYALYDALAEMKAPVTIIGYGAVQSISALVFQAGKRRLVTPGCRFLIHNGSVDLGQSSVNADALLGLSREVEYNNSLYHKILAERSGLNISVVEEMCRNETSLNAFETVRHGFADAVLLPSGHLVEDGQVTREGE